MKTNKKKKTPTIELFTIDDLVKSALDFLKQYGVDSIQAGSTTITKKRGKVIYTKKKQLDKKKKK